MAPLVAAAYRGWARTWLVNDADGIARRYVPVVRMGDRMVPSLAVSGIIAALGLRESDVRFDEAGLHLGDRLVRARRRPRLPRRLDGS